MRQLPDELTYYSNAPEAIYTHTYRPANKIPQPIRNVENSTNANFQQEVDRLNAKIANGPVNIPICILPWRSLVETNGDILATIPIHDLTRVSDGIGYSVVFNR